MQITSSLLHGATHSLLSPLLLLVCFVVFELFLVFVLERFEGIHVTHFSLSLCSFFLSLILSLSPSVFLSLRRCIHTHRRSNCVVQKEGKEEERARDGVGVGGWHSHIEEERRWSCGWPHHKTEKRGRREWRERERGRVKEMSLVDGHTRKREK